MIAPTGGVLKNFAIFTGKHVCWSVFFTKLQAFRIATLLKRDPCTGVFPWNLRNSEEHLFWKQLNDCFCVVYWLLHHILIFTILYSTGFTFLQITSSLLRNQNNRTNAVWGGFLWRSISLTKFLALKTIMRNFETVSWKRKKAASGYSQGKGTLNLNSNAYEKYEYEHLGCWYIKLTLFKRF